VGALDGDTLTAVAEDTLEHKPRLSGIDARPAGAIGRPRSDPAMGMAVDGEDPDGRRARARRAVASGPGLD